MTRLNIGFHGSCKNPAQSDHWRRKPTLKRMFSWQPLQWRMEHVLAQRAPTLAEVDVEHVEHGAHQQIGWQQAPEDAEEEPPVLRFHRVPLPAVVQSLEHRWRLE